MNTRLRANFNETDWADEQMHGLNYLFFLRELTETLEQDWPSVLAKLEEMRQILLNRNTMFCNITVDEANWRQFQPKLTGFLDALPAVPADLAVVPDATWSFSKRVTSTLSYRVRL